MFPTMPCATTIARLQAQARTEIHRLRGEAADDFWRGADAVWQRSQDLAQRSAERLKASLARRTHRSTNTTTKA